jgi:alanyl aminopeptidase
VHTSCGGPYQASRRPCTPQNGHARQCYRARVLVPSRPREPERSLGRPNHALVASITIFAWALGLAAGCGADPSPSSTTLRATASTRAPPAPLEPAPTFRLPTSARPLRYRLTLEVVPTRPTVRGELALEVALARPHRTVWLHAAGLSLERAHAEQAGRLVPVTMRASGGFVGLDAATPLTGEVTLHLAWEAGWGKHEGLYRVNVGGHAYAFTQLEALAARSVFPSFDEPLHKAPFELTLRVAPGDRALANTREVGRTPGRDGLDEVRFAPTPALPTYLVALAVGPLDVVDGPPVPASPPRKHTLGLRGVTTRGRGHELSYALARTGPLVSALEGYFGVAYPYDKLDVVAVPDKGGAMENAGLVTFRESLLLIDPSRASLADERAFASVMAHELAHQWFGNLVTLRWWDDLWLNEAFATWMGTKITDQVFPSLGAGLALSASVEEARRLDALGSVRRVREPIEAEAEIEAAFDGITYRKGASLLATYERWLGADTFRAGVRAYLGAHAHGTATGDDLFAALGAAAGRDVASSMKTLLDQPGLPLVRVTHSCAKVPMREPLARLEVSMFEALARLEAGGPGPAAAGAPTNKLQLKLSTSRLSPLGASPPPPEARYELPVCVRYPAGDALATTCVMAGREAELEARVARCPAWVHPDAGGTSYARFTLERAAYLALARHHRALAPEERLALARWLRAEVAQGTLSLTHALELARELAPAPETDVALVALELVDDAARLVGDDAVSLALARKVAKPLARELRDVVTAALPRAPEARRRALALLSFAALSLREPKARGALAKRAEAELARLRRGEPPSLDPDLAPLAFAVLGAESSAARVDELVSLLGKTTHLSTRALVVRALGAAEGEPARARLRVATLGEALRPNEVYPVLRAATSGSAGLAFLEESAEALAARLSHGALAELPRAAASRCSVADAERLHAAFAARITAAKLSLRTLRNVDEAIRLCAAQRERLGPMIRAASTASTAPP